LALGIFPALTHLLSCCRCQQFWPAAFD
jgi:hypothetical protein